MLDDDTESDLSVTDNNDLRTGLAMVMRIIDNFLAKFPEKIVSFTGSDDRRIRLYRIVNSRELAAIRGRFQIAGQLSDGQFEDFQPNREYTRFYIALKV